MSGWYCFRRCLPPRFSTIRPGVVIARWLCKNNGDPNHLESDWWNVNGTLSLIKWLGVTRHCRTAQGPGFNEQWLGINMHRYLCIKPIHSRSSYPELIYPQKSCTIEVPNFSMPNNSDESDYTLYRVYFICKIIFGVLEGFGLLGSLHSSRDYYTPGCFISNPLLPRTRTSILSSLAQLDGVEWQWFSYILLKYHVFNKLIFPLY